LLIERQPVPPAVLVYAAHTPAALIVAAAVADADAIVSKSSASAVLVEAIRSLARDPHPMSAISPRMKADAAERLDPADHAILAMRVAGESPVEIAATLRVPEPAIAKRITAIIAKLEPLGKAA
jgi:DNA-binding NarL/FixJ family response regulator